MSSPGPQRKIRATGLAWSSIDDATRTVLRPLIDAGILVTHRDPETSVVTVTFAGKEIAQNSNALAAYLEERQKFLVWRQTVHARSSLWDKGGRSPELLLSEEETRAAQQSRSEWGTQLTELELTFLDESLQYHGGVPTNVPVAEFTRMFVPQPAQAVLLPSPKPAESGLGEFTRMFQAPAPHAPSSSSGSANAPGEFTQLFGRPEPTPPPQSPATGKGGGAGLFSAPQTDPSFSPPPDPGLITARFEVPQPPSQPAAPVPPLATRRSSRTGWIVAAVTAVVVLGIGYSLLTLQKSKPQPAAQPSLLSQAHALVQSGSYDEAIKLFTQAIQSGQPVYAERAYANRLAGNLDAALADYAAAIKAGKTDAQTYADQAYVAGLKNDWSRSIELLTDAIKQDPSNVDYYVSRARAYLASGDIKAAQRDFDDALRRDPTSAAAQTGKVDVLKRLQVPIPAKELAPRVYVQISSEVQRAQARRLQDILTDLGYTVPPFEIVGQKSPARNEVRFIYPEDQSQAERLAAYLRRVNFPVTVRQIATPHTGDAHPRHFELWFAKVNATPTGSPSGVAQQKAY